MSYTENILETVISRNPGELEFHQAVEEVLVSIKPALLKHPEFIKHKIIDRLVEPDRQIMFRVPWVDDHGILHINRGFRVQFNNSIGPYKGGLRFHPSVYLGIIKFLGFEQVFKNALTGLPIGGSKGGSDFDPHGKSDSEIMRFCQSFMTELYRYIGIFVDVPAGDIGVSSKEIGFLFGQYKRIKNAHESAILTGKGLDYGGSLIRKEATGFGLIYFLNEMLNFNNIALKNKTIIISGSGNVATYACQKAQEFEANVVAMSDSKGYIYDPSGINIETIKQIKEINKEEISNYCNYHNSAKYYPNQQNIWSIKCDIALPCATQNDINKTSAKLLIDNGITAIGEGANMPCTIDATNLFLKNNILLAPAKAANAGGVATSALEMSQNSLRLFWSSEEVDSKLKDIMANIFKSVNQACQTYDLNQNYVAGANIAGFLKVANAMLAQGIV